MTLETWQNRSIETPCKFCDSVPPNHIRSYKLLIFFFTISVIFLIMGISELVPSKQQMHEECYSLTEKLDFNLNDPPQHLDRSDWYLNLVSDFCSIYRNCFSIARTCSFIDKHVGSRSVQAKVTDTSPMFYAA